MLRGAENGTRLPAAHEQIVEHSDHVVRPRTWSANDRDDGFERSEIRRYTLSPSVPRHTSWSSPSFAPKNSPHPNPLTVRQIRNRKLLRELCLASKAFNAAFSPFLYHVVSIEAGASTALLQWLLRSPPLDTGRSLWRAMGSKEVKAAAMKSSMRLFSVCWP